MGLETERFCLNDDDLTNLNWLQDGNLLKNVAGPILNNNNNQNQLNQKREPMNEPAQIMRTDQIVPQNESKPPFSFSCLIFMAIESSHQKALPVKQIYSWITDHFPFYRSASGGWKNTVRHNLSLNRCFRKVSAINDSLSVGKGSLWSVVPTYKQALLDSIRSTSECSSRHYLPTKTMMRPEFKFAPYQLQLVIDKAVIAKPFFNREADEAMAAECMLSFTQVGGGGKMIQSKFSQNQNGTSSTIKIDHDYTRKLEPLLDFLGDDDERKGAEALLNLSKGRNSCNLT